MHVLPDYRRIVLLTDGRLGVFSSKTASSLLRYRSDDVVAIIDSASAGRPLRDSIPWAPERPIVTDIAATLDYEPEALFIGVAPSGGALTAEMGAHVRDALRAGIDVVSGLHTRVAVDAECRKLAEAGGARMLDLREPPAEQIVATGRACETRCRRILTVGTDGNVGKMVAALELTRTARKRGLDARFLATGQTGIMIEGRGIAIDAVISDFAAGAVEEMVVASGECDVCVIEGQGSLGHPGFSGVTLALLHGSCPDAMILVHHAGRTHYKNLSRRPLPSLSALRSAYENVAGLLHPSRIVAVALNTHGLDRAAAARCARDIERELGIPVADVWRADCDVLLDAAIAT